MFIRMCIEEGGGWQKKNLILTLIYKIPARQPFSTGIGTNRTWHTIDQWRKVEEDGDGGYKKDAKYNPLGFRWAGSGKVIHQKGYHEYAKVKRREVMVEVGHTAHDKEGDIMKEPPKEQSLAYVQELVPLCYINIVVS